MSRIMARLKPVKISEKSTNYFLKRLLRVFNKEALKLNTLKIIPMRHILKRHLPIP